MALGWWGKGLWQICMHHWTAYAKVEFPRFPPDVRTGGSIPQLLNLNSEMNSKILQSFGGPFHSFWSELRNELNFFPSSGGPFHSIWSWTQKWIQNFSNLGVSIPQLLNLNSEMNSKIFQSWGVHSTTFDPELRNEFKIFPILGCPFHNFWSWTQKWILKFFKSLRDPFQNFWTWTQKLKFGIDISYGVSSNIKYITDISNLHFQ